APLKGHARYVYSVAFSPNGRTLASASADYTVKLWNVQEGKETNNFDGHTNIVNAVAFSPNGKMLASASADRTVRLLSASPSSRNRPQDLPQIALLNGHKDNVLSVAFSPDGNTLASASADNTIKLWNVKEEKEIATFGGKDIKPSEGHT